MSFRITQPIFHKVLHSGFHDEVYVDGESRELMLEIKKALSVFEPIDDDEARKIWLERSGEPSTGIIGATMDWKTCLRIRRHWMRNTHTGKNGSSSRPPPIKRIRF